MLWRAAWDDAHAQLTYVSRPVYLLDTATERMVHVDLPRSSPLAMPVLVLIGCERVLQSGADDALLIQAELLIAEAMAED